MWKKKTIKIEMQIATLAKIIISNFQYIIIKPINCEMEINFYKEIVCAKIINLFSSIMINTVKVNMAKTYIV